MGDSSKKHQARLCHAPDPLSLSYGITVAAGGVTAFAVSGWTVG
jgi:hypothetical protein